MRPAYVALLRRLTDIERALELNVKTPRKVRRFSWVRDGRQESAFEVQPLLDKTR